MATARTIGTAAQTTLWTVQTPGPASSWAVPSQADIAIVQAGILDDSLPAANPATFPGAYVPGAQQLFVPNRGVLKILPGDFIAYDTTTGWPILISARAAAGAGWVHT